MISKIVYSRKIELDKFKNKKSIWCSIIKAYYDNVNMRKKEKFLNKRNEMKIKDKVRMIKHG